MRFAADSMRISYPAMDTATRRALAEVNERFYASEAAAFAARRDHAWPGWSRLPLGPAEPGRPLRVLDAPCGNGRFGHFLGQRVERRRYLGIDANEELLAVAHAALPDGEFLERDLLADAAPPLPPGPFDVVTCFGFLHHVPGRAQRIALLAALATRLAPGGRLCVSVWRFAERERFLRRRAGWDAWNAARSRAIDLDQLETGDHLLHWGTEPGCVRYCHHADDDEVASWLDALPLRVHDRFRADGREGDLNLYLVLGPA